MHDEYVVIKLKVKTYWNVSSYMYELFIGLSYELESDL